jgi:hypothetical protein
MPAGIAGALSEACGTGSNYDRSAGEAWLAAQAPSMAEAATAAMAILVEGLPPSIAAPPAYSGAVMPAAGSSTGQSRDRSTSAVLPVVLEVEGEGVRLASTQAGSLQASLSSNSAGLATIQGGSTFPGSCIKDDQLGECRDSGDLLPGLPPALVDSIHDSSSGGEDKARCEPSSGQWPAAGAAMHGGAVAIAQLTV